MGWKPKSAEGIPGKRHQRRTWGASLKGSGRIFNMLGKYESHWSREVTALHLHFQSLHFWILVSYEDCPASSIPDFGFICFPPSRGVFKCFLNLLWLLSQSPSINLQREISSFHPFTIFTWQKGDQTVCSKHCFGLENSKSFFKRYYVVIRDSYSTSV